MSSTFYLPTTSLPRVQLKRVEGFDPEAFRFRGASSNDYDTFIREPCSLWDGDNLVAVYQDAGPLPGLAKLLSSIRYSPGARTEGLKTMSRTFGFLPRIAVRQNYCRPTLLIRENPRAFGELVAMSEIVSERFREASPQHFEHQRKMLEEVRPEWRLPGDVFTSGIVNQTSWLGYHFDAGNFDGAWSCMITTTLDIEGGSLVFPAYRLALSAVENRLFMFAGGKHLHGVSPIRTRNRNAYRYSIVWYPLQQMCHCLPAAEELKRARDGEVVKSRRTKEERLKRIRGNKK